MQPINDSSPPGSRRQTANQRVCAGHSDDDPRLRQLAALIAASPHNLVAAGERAEVFERHVVECDALAAELQPTGRWMDLGTGGGLPGLVLALRHPATHWTLVDATAKKVNAVREFAAALSLHNVTALHGRAETLGHVPQHRGSYDGVVTRAVAPLATLMELCRGFVADGGLLVAVKGPGWRAEVASAAAAAATLRVTVVHTMELPAAVRPTWVVTMRAEGPPPDGFPRRDGIPKHDPLA